MKLAIQGGSVFFGDLDQIKVGLDTDTSVVDYTYTANGRLETVEANSVVQSSYSYDPTSGWVATVATGGGITTTYQYDGLGRIDAVLHATPLLGLYHERLTYDLNGQVVAVDETWDENDREMIERDYTYDGVGRLTTSVVEDTGKEETTTQTQTYDAVGNRLTQTVNGTPTQSFSYTATNQVVGWTYDAAGNLLDDGEQTYTWDALGRLVGVDTGSANTYTYDGNGVLVQAQTDTLTTTYTQDTQAGLSQILVETVSVGELADPRRFWYGADRVATVGSLGATWLYHDYLGSVRLTKAGGSSPVPLSYDAWGVPTTGTPDPFGFTGELHSDTGLQYLRARWYNPATGTLLGRDPFAGDAEQPYSSHPYQYGYSQPTLYSDPSGRDPWYTDRYDPINHCTTIVSGDFRKEAHCRELEDSYDYRMKRPLPHVLYNITTKLCNVIEPFLNTPKTGDIQDWLWEAAYGEPLTKFSRYDAMLEYIYSEMITNSTGQPAAEMRFNRTVGFLPVVGLPFDGDAFKMFYDYVKPNGPWDHKPMLKAKFGYDLFFPVRDDPVNDRELFFDIWSNIHYGYVGRSVRISGAHLQYAHQRPGTGLTDDGDIHSVQVGIDLWDKYGYQLTKENLHQAILDSINILESFNTDKVRYNENGK